MSRRVCKGLNARGAACGANPLKDSEYCLFHDPEEAERADNARRMRRGRERKEAAIMEAFQIGGLETADGLRRALVVVLADVLGLENSIERARTITAIVQAANNVNKSDLGERVEALEEIIGQRGGGRRVELRRVR